MHMVDARHSYLQHNLPQDHPYVTTTHEIERIFGGRNLVVIGVESASGTVFDPVVVAPGKSWAGEHRICVEGPA